MFHFQLLTFFKKTPSNNTIMYLQRTSKSMKSTLDDLEQRLQNLARLLSDQNFISDLLAINNEINETAKMSLTKK